MVLARSNDSAVEAFSPGTRIRFLYADVSETTRRLSRSHGYPADASRLLGMSLAGAALIGLEVDPRDLFVVSVDCAGTAGGWHVECDGVGHLRGCLHSSAFPPPPDPEREDAFAPPPALQPSIVTGDGDRNPDGKKRKRPSPRRDLEIDALCGASATAKATWMGPDGDVRSQVSLGMKPGTPDALFVHLLSMGLPSRLQLVATTYDGEPDRVRALAMQVLPGGSREDVMRLESRFDDGTVADALSFDATLPVMREILGLEDLFTGPTQTLAMGCSCSEEKIVASYASKPRVVLEAAVRSGRPERFRCHLCGKVWEIPPERFLPLLQPNLPKRPGGGLRS